jgi:predicted transcriptional regulator
MAQETLKSLIAVMMTLTVQEQEQVITELQANVRQLNHVEESVRQQLIADAEEGIAEIQRGEYYTNDEVLDRMNQRLEQRYAAAV